MPQNKITIVETILFALFAGVGGMLSYLLRSLNSNLSPKFSRAFVEALSSAFVGLIAMLICKAVEIDLYWSGAIVGVFGWIGAETSMVIFTKIVKARFGAGDPCSKRQK